MNTEPMPKCPQCGAPLPPNAPAGLCPNCLMALNLRTETAFSGEQTAAQPPLPPGQIAPHFPQLEILECLGRGGMGVVYKARQKTLNRFAALKLLAPERVNDPKFAERFAREAQALAALNHPNIVTIYDFGQAGGFYYLLMEFVDGTNLRHLLQARKFTPEEALAIVPVLCDALQFAHERGIVHRDVKPENILLDRTGRVKVADFGIAKMLGNGHGETGGETASPQNATQSVVGTPGYIAPEQESDPKRVDSRADIYSLGVVFYEMLTGEMPGKPIEPPSHKVHIDVRLDEIVLRALEKKPELRYQQASILKTQVETLAATPPPLATAPVKAQTKAELKAAVLARVCFVLGIAGGFGFLYPLLFVCWGVLALIYVGIMVQHAVLGSASTPSFAGQVDKGWTAPESGWGWFVGRMFGLTFTSRSAFRLANLSGLGFLGLAGFLGHTPGLEWCLRLFGLFGLFGLSGLGFFAEFIARQAAAAPPVAAPSPKPDVDLLGAVYMAVFFLLVAWGSAVAMMIVSGLTLAVGLIWFGGGKRRVTLLVMLAAIGVASGVAMLVNQGLHYRPAAQVPGGQPQVAITRVSVDGNKIVIEGTAATGARIAFYADRRDNGWSCGFSYPDQFTATLEQGWTGLSCRVQPRLGKPVFTMGSGKYIGDVSLSDGKLVFRAGEPRQESDGVWSVTIGEFTTKSGKKMSVGVLLLPPRAEDFLPTQLTQEGWQLWQAGKLAEAAAKFQQAVQLAPSDANAWNGLGWAQFNSGQSAAAEGAFQKAVGIQPDLPGALNGLGQVYLSQRKYDDAEKYFLRAAPQAGAAWFGLARLYLLEGKYDQAAKWAQNIVDAGQADYISRQMLDAAKAKELSDSLRQMIEPPQPSSPSQVTPEAGTEAPAVTPK